MCDTLYIHQHANTSKYKHIPYLCLFHTTEQHFPFGNFTHNHISTHSISERSEFDADKHNFVSFYNPKCIESGTEDSKVKSTDNILTHAPQFDAVLNQSYRYNSVFK